MVRLLEDDDIFAPSQIFAATFAAIDAGFIQILNVLLETQSPAETASLYWQFPLILVTLVKKDGSEGSSGIIERLLEDGFPFLMT